MDRFAKIISLPLLVNDILVDLASGQVVVFGQSDIEEALVVAEVQVHLPSIIQHKHLPCTEHTCQACGRTQHKETSSLTATVQEWRTELKPSITERLKRGAAAAAAAGQSRCGAGDTAAAAPPAALAASACGSRSRTGHKGSDKGDDSGQARQTLTESGALTVLVRREGAGVDVDVGVDLDGGDMQPARLEDGADAAGDDPLADARDHAARDQDVLHLPRAWTRHTPAAPQRGLREGHAARPLPLLTATPGPLPARR